MAGSFWQEMWVERYALLICIFINIAAFQFGYDSAYYSGILAMQPFLEIYGTLDPASGAYVMSAELQSLTTSIINAGEFVGAVTSYYIGDKCGRRGSIFVSSAIVIVGTTIQVASTHLASLIVGRLVLGYAVGLISCFVPIYVADLAPARFRGFLVTFYQQCVGLGLLTGVVVDYCTSTRLDTGSFRIPMAVQYIFPIIVVPGLMLFAPESPRWLVQKGKLESARKALRRIRGDRAALIDNEMRLLQAEVEFDAENLKAGSWLDLFRKGPDGRKAYLGASLQALQQATGINFITGYGIVFFFAIGIDKPFLIQIGLYVIALPIVIFSGWAIDRFGRRGLLIASGIACAIVLMIMGASGVHLSQSKSLATLIVAMVYIFLCSFNLAWGPTVWVVTSEISTGPNRARLMSFSTASNWLFNWLVSFTFPYLFNADAGNLGSKVGFIYGSLTVFACVWVWFMLPETAGRSLEEIDRLFAERVPTRQFKHHTLRSQDIADEKTEKTIETIQHHENK